MNCACICVYFCVAYRSREPGFTCSVSLCATVHKKSQQHGSLSHVHLSNEDLAAKRPPNSCLEIFRKKKFWLKKGPCTGDLLLFCRRVWSINIAPANIETIHKEIHRRRMFANSWRSRWHSSLSQRPSSSTSPEIVSRVTVLSGQLLSDVLDWGNNPRIDLAVVSPVVLEYFQFLVFTIIFQVLISK